MKKKGVKKGSAQARAFSERQTARKQGWTRNVYKYAQQATLDAASLVLNEIYGFGPERLKRFGEAYERKFAEICALQREDTDDREYSEEKFEEAMRRAWGPYYEDHTTRYSSDYSLDENGNIAIER